MGPKELLGPFGRKSNLRRPLYVLCAVLIAAAAYLRNDNCLNSLRMDGDTASVSHQAVVPLLERQNLGTFEPVTDVLRRMISDAKGFRNPRDPRRFVLLLMTIDALLVYIIAVGLGLRLRWGLAAGLTYLLSPMHSINWSVSAASHYLVAAFTMAGFVVHLEARRNGMTASRLLGLAACCVLALGSKESGLVFPGLLLTFDFLVPAKDARRAAAGRYLEHGVLIGLALVYLAVRWTFSGRTDISSTVAALSPGHAWERLLQALFIVRTPLAAACLALLALRISGKIAPLAMRRACFFGSWFLLSMLVYLAAPRGYMIDGHFMQLATFSERYLVFPFAGVAWLVGAALDECESKLGPLWTGGLVLAVFCPLLLNPAALCEDRAAQVRRIEHGLSVCGGRASNRGECLTSALSLPLAREKDSSAHRKFVDGLRAILPPDEAGAFLRFFEIDYWSRDAGRRNLVMEAWMRMADSGNPASFSVAVADYHRAADRLAAPPEKARRELAPPGMPAAGGKRGSPGNAEHFIIRAERAAKAGDRAAALAALKKGRGPSLAEDESRRLAEIYGVLGEYAEAVKILEALASRLPAKPEHWLDLADAAARAGDRAAALEAVGRAKKFPLTIDERHRLALTYQSLRSFKDALLLLDQLVSERPSNAQYINDRGVSRYYGGMAEAAVADFRLAIKLDPKLLPAYASLGAILISRNQRPEAVRLYDRALANAPKNTPPSLLESIRRARGDALRSAPPIR